MLSTTSHAARTIYGHQKCAMISEFVELWSLTDFRPSAPTVAGQVSVERAWRVVEIRTNISDT